MPHEPIFTDRARRKDLARWVRSQLALIMSWILAGGEMYKLKTPSNTPLAAFWGLLDAFGSTIIDHGDAQVGHRVRK